jgi:hypothetical protein
MDKELGRDGGGWRETGKTYKTNCSSLLYVIKPARKVLSCATAVTNMQGMFALRFLAIAAE